MGADAKATFAVELQDQTSGAADSAVSALERLRQKIKEGQAALGEMQAAMQRLRASAGVEQFLRQSAALAQLEQQMKRLQAGSAVNIERYRELQAKILAARAAVEQLSKDDSVQAFLRMRDAINAKKQALASAEAEFVKLGGTFGKVNDGANNATQGVKEAGAGLDDLLGSAQAAGGPLGNLAGRAGQLKGALGKGGTAGALVLVIALLAALVAGVAIAGAALAGFALRAADAARSTRLLLGAATGSADAGGALAAQIDAVAGRVAIARSELREMAVSLARTRLQGRALEAAFSAVATATAVMGAAAGSKLQGIAEEAARTRRFVVGAFDLDGTGLKLADVGAALAKRLGISMNAAVAAIQNGQVRVEDGLRALDDAIQAKFGRIAKAQLLSFSSQLQRLRENAGRIFEGVNIEPFLEGLRSVLSLFDQSTVSGRALKVLAEGLLNPLFASLAKGAPYARAFFQGMIIGALLIGTTVLRIKKAFDSAFGTESTSKVDGLRLAMLAGASAVGALLGLLLILAAPFIFIGSAIYRVYSQAQMLYTALSALDFGTIGTNLVQGLAQGIEAGATWAVNAIKRLAGSMMGSIKAALGIASPSKVFAVYGRFTAQGFAKGIEGGAPEVDTAVRGLVSLPAAEPPAASSTTVRNQRGGNTYNITINGVRDAEQLKSPSFLAQLASALEGSAISGGIPLDPEPA